MEPKFEHTTKKGSIESKFAVVYCKSVYSLHKSLPIHLFLPHIASVAPVLSQPNTLTAMPYLCCSYKVKRVSTDLLRKSPPPPIFAASCPATRSSSLVVFPRYLFIAKRRAETQREAFRFALFSIEIEVRDCYLFKSL